MAHRLRHSSLFFLLNSLGLLTILLLAAHAAPASRNAGAAETERLRLARSLQLTDLCIFTEARYTRHPAMADNHAPFQEHPSALEHFPSGALLIPPQRLLRKP